MLNEIRDLWFGYLIRKSGKEGKMNIPVVASKKNQMKKMDQGSAFLRKSNEEDGLGLCFPFKIEDKEGLE